MNSLPPSVMQYLLKQQQLGICSGYVCVDKDSKILHSDGHIASTDLQVLNKSEELEQELIFLAELLPASHTATVIHNLHIDDSHYFDVHLFSDEDGDWVVFIDNTVPAIQLQKEQQERLELDFANDKRKTGN